MDMSYLVFDDEDYSFALVESGCIFNFKLTDVSIYNIGIGRLMPMFVSNVNLVLPSGFVSSYKHHVCSVCNLSIPS